MQYKTTRMRFFITTLLMVAALFYGLSVKAQLRQGIDSVSATLPARMWDGMWLKAIQFDDNQHMLTMKMEPVKLHRQIDPNSVSDMKTEGCHIVSDCVRAHSHVMRGMTDMEGDAPLWRTIVPMLHSVVSDSITLQLELRDKQGHHHAIQLSPSDVSQAIELGKKKAVEYEVEAEEMKQGIYRVKNNKDNKL